MSTGRPRISVCLTTWNRAATLGATIEGVLAQSERDFELIVSDDASPDGTEAVVRRYCALDGRVRYRRNPRNLGMPGNLNAAIAEARGELIANLHDGDEVRVDLLAQWRAALDRLPDAWFVFNAYRAQDRAGRPTLHRPPFRVVDGRAEGAWLALHYFRTVTSCVWGTVMARAEAYRRHGAFDPRFGAVADVDRWLTLAAAGPVAYVDEPLIRLRPRETGHPWNAMPWRFLFWDLAIYARHLGVHAETARPFVATFPRLIRRRCLRLLAQLARRGRSADLAEGLALLRDAPDPWLRALGRLGDPRRRPAWAHADLWRELDASTAASVPSTARAIEK